MRYLSADYIFPIATAPIKNGVVGIDDEGLIVNVYQSISEVNIPKEKIEFREGIICPGFINTHCHLELSHLRSKISEKKGMMEFIKEIISIRGAFTETEIQQAIVNGENEMIKNGIVAVGDIANNNSTFQQKAKGNLAYHTFIEVFDLNPDKASEVFERALQLKSQLKNTYQINHTQKEKTHSSITPHAPYSVSEKLFYLINDYAIQNNSIISIHNQESEGENELFVSKTGVMLDTFKKMGINTDLMRITGVNSLQSTLPLLPKKSKKLFVHNTYTSIEDIKYATTSDTFWCTCPNANLYIENKLPNYNYFISENARLTIGTDSLGSNWSLSVLDEIKTITKYHPEIPLQTLLTWATKNGADFLEFDYLGTIEIGKRPGLNLLKNVGGLKISEKTEVLKLI